MKYLFFALLTFAVMDIVIFAIILVAYLHDRKHGCKYCHGQKNDEVEICPPIKLKETACKTDMKDCQIILDDYGDPALMIFNKTGAGSFLEIRYCPMCGRKLK